jgi:hypothetical protein
MRLGSAVIDGELAWGEAMGSSSTPRRVGWRAHRPGRSPEADRRRHQEAGEVRAARAALGGEERRPAGVGRLPWEHELVALSPFDGFPGPELAGMALVAVAVRDGARGARRQWLTAVLRLS